MDNLTFKSIGWVVLDIDNCLYEGLNLDGSFTEYKKHMRSADENWAVSLTGDLAGLRAFRQEEAPKIGMDASLLKFISLKTGRDYGINDLASHRRGFNGYCPQNFLKHDGELVKCLENIKKKGLNLAVATDNPAGLEVLRILGIHKNLIPDIFVFDSVHFQMFKSPEFYKKIINHLKINPGQAVVYGDSEYSDVLAPKSVGMNAYLAKGRAELIKLLENHFLNNEI